MPGKRPREFDITKNIRMIEGLKSEMLSSVAEIFSILSRGTSVSREVLAGCLGNIIIACYLLGKRLGVHYGLIDQIIEERLKLGIIEGSDIEKSYGDLSGLQEHLREQKSGP